MLVKINSSPEHKVRKLHDELLFWCMSNVKLVDALMVMPSDNVLGKTARRGDNIEVRELLVFVSLIEFMMGEIMYRSLLCSFLSRNVFMHKLEER